MKMLPKSELQKPEKKKGEAFCGANFDFQWMQVDSDTAEGGQEAGCGT